MNNSIVVKFASSIECAGMSNYSDQCKTPCTVVEIQFNSHLLYTKFIGGQLPTSGLQILQLMQLQKRLTFLVLQLEIHNCHKIVTSSLFLQKNVTFF